MAKTNVLKTIKKVIQQKPNMISATRIETSIPKPQNVKQPVKTRLPSQQDVYNDPYSYMDDQNPQIRDYVRMIITGKPVDYESVFRNRYEYDSSIPYSDNDSNIEELKKIKRDYIKNIDDF